MGNRVRVTPGEKMIGIGLVTQDAIFRNRQRKVYGRVFGNR